ncbi:MAG: cell division protein FtsZ, partial [Methanoregulaceae archaeon]|nr:cell division protein FtsZ [Methanoregulaceae archaeon]
MRSIVEEALTKVNADTAEVRTENEDLDQILKELKTEIAVFGCGGSGSNTITRMKEEGIHGAK